MNPSPNREVALFSAALELPAGQRGAYLQEACADDPALRLRLEALLRVHEEAIPFLEAPPAEAQQSPMGAKVPEANISMSVAPSEQVGDRIGRYKLLQQIGEGGCGVVYMAEQEEPVRRRVALKVIKLGMDTKQVIARFEAERQALALMDHPNIAKVLDAGATDTGRLFFVMELVRGIKITDHCDQNNLSTEERLKLFMQVCQAIQHAHQKGIIHRDIKPSNILVTITEPGAPGCPKVIDFGIAKATTGQHLTDKTVFTAFEQFIGTPAYMSPEQAMMTTLDIDTRTDIYALGVLLYELLTGQTPFDAKDLMAAGLDAMRRTICEKEPARPSTRLSKMVESELTTTAKHRHIDPPKLVHLLRGDLDWIVIKALEKNRARRYETANGLARDVERFLSDEPVAARPPSAAYRFQKLARRHKLVFAAASAVAAALIVGLAFSTWEYFKERKARQQAVAVSDLLQQLLGSANRDGLKGADYTVRQLLDDFSPGLTNELAGQPETEASMRETMGWTYFRLGELAKAESNLQQALVLRRSTLGPKHPDTLQTQHLVAWVVFNGLRRREEGARLAYEVWQSRKQVLGTEDGDTLTSQELYAQALCEGGHIQEAEAMQRQILQIRQRDLGPDHSYTIFALGNLGATLGARGDWVQAQQCIQQALKGLQRIGYADQEDGFICVKQFAIARLFQGDPAQAEKLLVEAVGRAEKKLGANHRVTLHIKRTLARAYAEEGRFVEAEALSKETLNARRLTKSNQDSIGTGYTLLYLGRALVEQGKQDEAEPFLQEAMTLLREDATVKPELTAQAANWLGVIRIGRKAYPEAEELMLPSSDRFFATNTVMTPNERRVAVGHIVNLYQAWEKPEQMTAWQKKLDQLAETQPNHKP